MIDFSFTHHRAFGRVLALCLIASTGFSQGINFLGGSYQNAVETARRANKVLFVEVYLTGCPHCAAIAPVLEEKQVGDFFNANFVSYKMEANSDNSKQMQQQKGISYVEFPLFFFFDPSTGSLVHQAAPMERHSRPEFIEEVLRHGKDALDPTKRITAYPARFAKGDRDLVFLVNYAKYAKATKDKAKLEQINTEIAKVFKTPADLESQNAFYILQNLISDAANPMAVHFFKNLPKFKAKYKEQPVKEAGQSIIFLTMYENTRSGSLSAEEILKFRQYFVQLGDTPKAAAKYTILKELEALFRTKATATATASLNNYRKVNQLVLADYSYLVRLFNEKASDSSYAPSLVTWVNEALKLVKPNERNSKEVADLYFEQAKAFLKMGKKTEARQASQVAVSTAKAAKVDVAPYQTQLASIK